MPKIHPVDQLSGDWLKLHIGRVTGSELQNLVTPEFAIRTGEMPKTYLYKKLAEAYRGQPMPGFSTWTTEQGQELEAEARAWYRLEYDDHRVHTVGFIEHDNGRCGASPDGLLGDEGGLEIKSPEPHTHVKYLMQGTLPKEYAPQVHMNIYATGRKWWRFVSYRRGFPALVLHIARDETIIAKIEKALEGFYTEFDAGMKKLREHEEKQS